MNKKTIDLTLSEYYEEGLYHLDENYKPCDNTFGWSVAYAEVYFDDTNQELLEYRLFSKDEEEQSRAKKIKTQDITYWHFEFIGRELNFSPDPFEPKLEKFVKHFYRQNQDLLNEDLSLPIVSYELSNKKQLTRIRYSLSARNIDCKPLFDIGVKDGLIFAIADFQTKETKNTAYPIPDHNDYFVESKNKRGKIEVLNGEEREITFKGIDNDYVVKYKANFDGEKELQKYGFFVSELRDIINAPELLLKYIPTVNYHLIKNCDMHCRHCFSDFNELSENKLSFESAKQIIQEISNIKSFKKINFSGGEPTIFKGIEQLIRFAKEQGLETSMVTNCYNLVKTPDLLDELKGCLDLLVFSIDSFEQKTNIEIGRCVGEKKQTISYDYFLRLAQKCNDYGIKIKINTVVTKLNCNENLAKKIATFKPIRWKILRMLPVESQNDDAAKNYYPTDEEYNNFITNNKEIAEELGVKVVAEENEDMIGSYLMISPDGKFFNNVDKKHSYSKPILSEGVESALKETPLMREIFYKREGDYSCA